MFERVEGIGLSGVVGDEQVECSVAIDVTDGDPHAAFGFSDVAERDAGPWCSFGQGEALGRDRSPVTEQEVGSGVVGNEEVELLVAVKVGGDDTQSLAFGLCDSARVCDVTKAAIARVDIESILSGLEVAGATGTCTAGIRRTGRHEDIHSGEVVDDIEIGQSVLVEVGEHAADRPFVTGDSCFACGVAVGAITVVDQQPVASDVGDVDIGEPVAIDVTDGDALSVANLLEAGLERDVLEPSVGGIPEQSISRRCFRPSDRCAGCVVAGVDGSVAALGEVEIGPTIAIEVDHTGTAPDRFGQPAGSDLLGSAAEVQEFESGGLSVVAKGDRSEL